MGGGDEYGLAKLEGFVVLEHVADAVDERRFGRVEPLQGLDGGGSRCIG